MQDFSARTVFFVEDTPRAIEFYTGVLGFNLDWTYKENDLPFVVQVSLFGLQIIINQKEAPTDSPPGCGRVFIGLDEAQSATLLEHIEARGIKATYTFWGEPTLAFIDLDENQIFFWLSDAERIKWREMHEGTGTA